jgi:hypothetical protein
VRTRLLVVLLSLLLVSTQASAWACDMFCSLHRMHSDCHTARSATTDNQTAMSMSENIGMDMEMGSDQSEPMIGPHTGVNPTPNHSMSMSSEMGMAPKRFDPATQPHSGKTATTHHSKTVSSCSHEPCSQVSASRSPLSGDRSRPNHQQWIAIRIVSPDSLYIRFHRIRLEIPPPKILADDRLTTTLRI